MSKMFKSVGTTWSAQHGCEYGCEYCRAKTIAERLSVSSEKYRDGFKPGFWELAMNDKFKPGVLVFVSFMGDLFGPWVKRDIIQRVINRTREFPLTSFLFLSKNPARFHDFIFPYNSYLGTTLETNVDIHITRAPMPRDRYQALLEYDHPNKFVSIEPIMDFDKSVFIPWFVQLMPSIVEIGSDNYNNNLPEPKWENVSLLINSLKDLGITVFEKDSLERLKGK